MRALLILLALLIPVAAWGGEPQPMVWRPMGHALFAGAATYTLVTLCERTLWARRQEAPVPWSIRWGCRGVVVGGVIAVASWERHDTAGFQARDWWADLAGTGVGLVVLEW